MSDGKVVGNNSRLKRSNYDEDKVVKEELPYKLQRFCSPLNDDESSQNPIINTQYENCEITEQNYKTITATTLYKKLQVLETHDRLLRSTTLQPSKELNVDEIKPMEGTCYDMCPEKERLLRIHGNMVSQFECKMVDSKLEPVIEIMVKQYARSSADQANPLPHELRPTPVLVKTMNYMLKNIIYPIESNIEQDLASWYDFCWDRMRAIRKDIVQQNLQNSEVITILEQIGRFHIACYDLMLGYSGFDIKLNTENLNNCIQMLMPMYRDSDHLCPNEPEFVSYELLMHLGNPQFHTAYDLLPIHIKQSPQVRFCIKAHTMYLQSSDCIDFFNLLKNATYMNCCILQRVIPNIRYNNLQMMNMSFTTVKRIYKLEFKYFMKKLCFDDIQSAQEFCSDIQLKFDDMHIDLSRKIALNPPKHRRQRQEFIIVEKRQNLTFLISEIHNLPDVMISSVHSSFDSDEHFNDTANYEVIKNDDSDISNYLIETNTCSSSNSIDEFSFAYPDQQYTINPSPSPTSVVEIPTYTFNLPLNPVIVQSQPFNFRIPLEPKTPSMLHDDSLTNFLTPSTSLSLPCQNNLPNFSTTFNDNLFVKPQDSVHLNTIQPSNKICFNEIQPFASLTYVQINLAKKYFDKWQNCVNYRKSKCIEEVFAQEEFFHSECISSLSSSQSSVESIILNDVHDFDVVPEEPKKWLHKQFLLAEKYFYIWLRNTLRKRRKIEIDPVTSLPWSVFMQVHGTPKETMLSTSSRLKTKKGKRVLNIPISHPLNQDETNDGDFSEQIANLFVRNVLNTQKDKLDVKKVFWKLAINYGESPDLYSIENKVRALIYGKIGFSNDQVQIVCSNNDNIYFIKSVKSCSGAFDWSKSGLNAALVFTNTGKEHIETLFNRVDCILQSTPTAVPLVLIFSSTSNQNEIENYQSVLDAYCENDYINNYLIKIWQGPITIIESMEFLSNNYVDITPGMRSEKLYYNLLNFAQSFYLKVRCLLPENNPNTIIETYNKYLDAYIKRLGENNLALRDLASEFIPYYTQNPDAFSTNDSNLNLKYFEDILNNAHLFLCKKWPPQNIDDLIDYVKNMCKLTNRRCWCLDILQLLQLHRKADLDYCLLNASWYEVIEIWIEGTLNQCSNSRDNFTIFYNGNPIVDALKTVFPDSKF